MRPSLLAPLAATAVLYRRASSAGARLLAEARDAGASDVYALMELTRGLPVTAGLTVVPIEVTEDEHTLLATLQQVFGDTDGVLDSGPRELAGLPALQLEWREP